MVQNNARRRRRSGLHTNFISVSVNGSWLSVCTPRSQFMVSEDVVCKTDSPMIVLIANGT